MRCSRLRNAFTPLVKYSFYYSIVHFQFSIKFFIRFTRVGLIVALLTIIQNVLNLTILNLMDLHLFKNTLCLIMSFWNLIIIVIVHKEVFLLLCIVLSQVLQVGSSRYLVVDEAARSCDLTSWIIWLDWFVILLTFYYSIRS